MEASGEVAELKDNINSMVESLRETTRANQEQDWLKTNLARISGLMQGHRDLPVVAELIMDELAPLASAQYGAFYLAEDDRARTRAAAGGLVRLSRRHRPAPAHPRRALPGRAGRAQPPPHHAWTSCRRAT